MYVTGILTWYGNLLLKWWVGGNGGFSSSLSAAPAFTDVHHRVAFLWKYPQMTEGEMIQVSDHDDDDDDFPRAMSLTAISHDVYGEAVFRAS